LVRRQVGRQPGLRRHDHDGAQGIPEAAIAIAEEGQDQEWAKHQADERARPASDLDQLLADERQQSNGRLHEDHAAAQSTAGPLRRMPSRWRPTRIANTSSNDGRASLVERTSIPARPMASTTSGIAVAASSTV